LHYECGLYGEGYCYCECGEWEDVTVTWTSPSGTQESWTGSCGETFGLGSILLGTPIEINTSITCGPSPPCRLEPNYGWEVTEVGPGPPFNASGTTLPISFIPTATGWNTFKVELNASCDSPCTPCTIKMRVNPSGPCIDIEKKVLDPDTGELVDNIEVPVGTKIDFVITVCNCGTSDLESIKVVDYFDDCLEYLDSEASVTIDDISISGNQVTWEFGSLTLHPGDCFDIKVKAKVVSEGNCENCVEVHAESQGESISDKDCVVVTGTRSGICLGSVLLTGMLALGVVVLNRKKE
jgi:fimbrial isopeptide formation D2 family protein